MSVYIIYTLIILFTLTIAPNRLNFNERDLIKYLILNKGVVEIFKRSTKSYNKLKQIQT